MRAKVVAATRQGTLLVEIDAYQLARLIGVERHHLPDIAPGTEIDFSRAESYVQALRWGSHDALRIAEAMEKSARTIREWAPLAAITPPASPEPT